MSFMIPTQDGCLPANAWSEEEERIIGEFLEVAAPAEIIAERLPGRTISAVRNRLSKRRREAGIDPRFGGPQANSEEALRYADAYYGSRALRDAILRVYG